MLSAIAGFNVISDMAAIKLKKRMLLGPELDHPNQVLRPAFPHFELVGGNPVSRRFGRNEPRNSQDEIPVSKGADV